MYANKYLNCVPQLKNFVDRKMLNYFKSEYLIRFDDICPTMNWNIWDKLEDVINKYGVKPILAVVPENLDRNLMKMEPNFEFWSRVRGWQAKGWTIALHGHTHVYETKDSGIIGLNPRSEFAGLPKSRQREKLIAALEIFKSNDVIPQAWIAPAHSFDTATVELLVELGINNISDGFYFRPISMFGARWIPQQLWRFKKMPLGLWTICYHHNNFKEEDVIKFENNLAEFNNQITSFEAVQASYNFKKIGLIDIFFNLSWNSFLVFLKFASKLAGR